MPYNLEISSFLLYKKCSNYMIYENVFFFYLIKFFIFLINISIFRILINLYKNYYSYISYFLGSLNDIIIESYNVSKDFLRMNGKR